MSFAYSIYTYGLYFTPAPSEGLSGFGAGLGGTVLLLLTLSPSPRSQVYADTSPFLKGPGLEGSSWLIPLLGAHLRFSTSLSHTDPPVVPPPSVPCFGSFLRDS